MRRLWLTGMVLAVLVWGAVPASARTWSLQDEVVDGGQGEVRFDLKAEVERLKRFRDDRDENWGWRLRKPRIVNVWFDKVPFSDPSCRDDQTTYELWEPIEVHPKQLDFAYDKTETYEDEFGYGSARRSFSGALGTSIGQKSGFQNWRARGSFVLDFSDTSYPFDEEPGGTQECKTGRVDFYAEQF